ncbi:MAG TPA: DUF2892 domain-containing protein [Polyangiales bacterium]|nr:DUF2892 domain-containing protein [Polyangiales bacterium]
MSKNAGTVERLIRGLVAAGLLVGAVAAPYSLAVRVGVFGVAGGYLLFTALAGTCLGYKLIGRSTCPAEPR